MEEKNINNSSLSEEKDKCAICLNFLIEKNRLVYTTICGHKFHNNCFMNIHEYTNTIEISQEISGKNTNTMFSICPCCRTKVEITEKHKVKILRKDITMYKIFKSRYKIKQNEMLSLHSDIIRLLNEKLKAAKRDKLSSINTYKKEINITCEKI